MATTYLAQIAEPVDFNDYRGAVEVWIDIGLLEADSRKAAHAKILDGTAFPAGGALLDFRPTAPGQTVRYRLTPASDVGEPQPITARTTLTFDLGDVVDAEVARHEADPGQTTEDANGAAAAALQADQDAIDAEDAPGAFVDGVTAERVEDTPPA